MPEGDRTTAEVAEQFDRSHCCPVAQADLAQLLRSTALHVHCTWLACLRGGYFDLHSFDTPPPMQTTHECTHLPHPPNPCSPSNSYAPTAVLLPTVSNKVRTTPEEIVDYFVNFLQLKPRGAIDEVGV